MPHLTEAGVLQGINELASPIITECKDGKERICAYPYGFEPTLHKYRLGEPKKLKKPQNIFVCSMGDLFADWVHDEWIEEVFEACEEAPWHRYLFLTKNPERYIDLEEQKMLPCYDNFYFGTTVTSPESRFTWFADKKYHWFISIEPMLARFGEISPKNRLPEWIIIGAETGSRKNKVVPEREWIEDISKLCNKQNIPLFMKDSLVPIMGEENMRREFPWSVMSITKETVEARAVKIAAEVMEAAGLCRYDSVMKCHRLFTDPKTCAACLRKWLLSKAKRELKRDTGGIIRNERGKS